MFFFTFVFSFINVILRMASYYYMIPGRARARAPLGGLLLGVLQPGAQKWTWLLHRILSTKDANRVRSEQVGAHDDRAQALSARKLQPGSQH